MIKNLTLLKISQTENHRDKLNTDLSPGKYGQREIHGRSEDKWNRSEKNYPKIISRKLLEKPSSKKQGVISKANLFIAFKYGHIWLVGEWSDL